MDGLETRTRLEPPQNIIIIVIANWSLIRLYTYTNDANDDDHRSSILPHLHDVSNHQSYYSNNRDLSCDAPWVSASFFLLLIRLY